MALAINHTFAKAQLDADIKAGKYGNIRLFQYGDMGTQYQEVVPAYVTTTGTLNDHVATSSGTWSNLTMVSPHPPTPSPSPSPVCVYVCVSPSCVPGEGMEPVHHAVVAVP